MDARNMNTMVMMLIAGEPKAPMLAVREEKPPVAQMLKAWQTASKTGMPARR